MVKYLKWLFTRWYYWVLFSIIFLINIQSFISDLAIYGFDSFAIGQVLGFFIYPFLIIAIPERIIYFIKRTKNKNG